MKAPLKEKFKISPYEQHDSVHQIHFHIVQGWLSFFIQDHQGSTLILLSVIKKKKAESKYCSTFWKKLKSSQVKHWKLFFFPF